MPDLRLRTGRSPARLARLTLRPAREREIIDELSQHLDDRYQELRAARRRPTTTRCGWRSTRSMTRRDDDLLAREMRPLRQASAPEPIAPGGPAARPARRCLAGPRLCRAHAAQESRLRRRGRPDARARDRRQHRDLLPRRCGVAAAPAGGGAGASRPRQQRRTARGDGRSNFSYPQFAYLREHADPVAKVFAYAPIDLNLSAGESHRRAGRAGRLRQLLLRPRRRAGHRPRIRRRRTRPSR